MSISSGSATLGRSARSSTRHRLAVVGAVAGVLTLGAALVPAATFASGSAEGEPPLVSGQLGEIPLEVPAPGLPLRPPSATLTSELLDAAAQVGASPVAGSPQAGKATPRDGERAPASGTAKAGKAGKAGKATAKPGKATANRIEGATSALLQGAAAAGSGLDTLTVASTVQTATELVRDVTGALAPTGQSAARSASPRPETAARAASGPRAAEGLAAFYAQSTDPIPPLRTEVLRDASVQIDAQPAGDSQPLTGLGLALIPVALVGAAFAFRLRPAGGRHAA